LRGEQAEVIARARAGDLEAFRKIHQYFGHRIINFIHRMVDSREDAEDLSQNVFLRAFQEVNGLRDPDRFESWLFQIARNEVYQAFRKKRGEPQTREIASPGGFDDEPKASPTDERPTPHDQLLHAELGQRIRGLLSSLPPKQREVFVLSVIEEKSYSEIAEIVGRSLLSVKTDIFRARRSARAVLGSYLERGK